MQIETINLINYSLHIILLCFKIVLVYKLIKQIGVHSTAKNRSMIVYSPIILSLSVFTVIYSVCEIMFINVFNDGIDFYYYEFIAILDQIIFTGLAILYFNFIKGESDGKNTK